MKYYTFLILHFTFYMVLVCCGNKTQRANMSDTIPMQPCPRFEAERAMQSIVAQCDFGPRVPGTRAWQQCGDYIVSQFEGMGLAVEQQTTTVVAYDGSKLPCRNIIASLHPNNPDRILLCAHWDSRPWADNDSDERNHHTPVLAANDGASGVAVLLELARILSGDANFKTGIDFICFDAEDCGTPQWDEGNYEAAENTWCLGSTYWSEKAVENGYQARYGILFDMVGGRGATFSQEGYSMTYAQPVADMLWHIARQIGYGHYFPISKGGYITDDHVSINQTAGIPCIDIVPYHKDGPSSFGPTWHTVHDTPENIDTEVLEAVGQSVLQMVYNER
ncbi:MAG: M28 family peptidase [Bacteroidaceae bacterium]|nr:M28 family peptidase [Bacteroidaceae bacterium]